MIKGSSLKSFIVIVVTAALMLFAYVASITEIKRMKKEKITKQELLNERRNRLDDKSVDIQKLTAEDRIVKFAQDSLGLVRPVENLETIFISKEQIKQIEKLLNEKYD
jgi:cell division protein FtsL